MSEPKGAIPRLVIFIIGLILGIMFVVPDEVNIGVMILEALAKAIQPLGVGQANQWVGIYIIMLRIFGVVLIVVDILVICILFYRRQYF
jgi:hypothetical protein